MSTTSILSTHDLSVGYGQATVAADLNLEVHAGEVVALLGRNGAGKTTTLMSLAGAIPSLGGTVEFLGAPLVGPLHSRARKGIALIPETRAIVRKLTVVENLRLGEADVEAAFSLFPELRKFAKKQAGLLSGGEQQMLVLGRVLAVRPRLMLVDELSFRLAPLIVRRLLESLRDAVSQVDTGVLLVEQHPHAALSVADRGYVMSQGRVAMQGDARDLRARLPEIEEAYLSGSSISQ